MRKIIILAVAILVFGAGCQKDTEVYYTGTVESDSYFAMNSVSGQIVDMTVNEGDSVQAGTVLARIDSTSLLIERDRLEAARRAAVAELDQLVSGARSEEINQIRKQIDQQQEQISIMREQWAYSKDQLEKTRQLFDGGAVSEQALIDVRLTSDNAARQLDQAVSQKSVLEEKLNLLLGGATREQLAAAKARVDMAEQSIALIEAQLKRTEIIAVRPGVVESVYFSLGEQYPAMAKLMKVSEMGSLEVTVFIEEKNLHSISVGDSVHMRLDYDPERVLTGRIEFISSEGEFTPKNLESRENRQEVVYETRIRVDKTDKGLKPGMLVDVYIGDENND